MSEVQTSAIQHIFALLVICIPAISGIISRTDGDFAINIHGFQVDSKLCSGYLKTFGSSGAS